MLKSIQFLGYSGGVPTPDSGTSSCIIDNSDVLFLIDCSEGTFKKLLQFKYKINRVNAIFITHMHPDHISGLIPFLFYKHVIKSDTGINIYGPKNIEKYLLINFEQLGFSPSFALNICEIYDNQKYQYRDLDIRTKLLEHGLDCFGYRISDKIKNITFITDTRKNSDIIDFSLNTDLLILESTFPVGMEKMAFDKFHISVSDALEIADSAQVKRLLLTHFSPRIKSSSLKNIHYNGYPCFINFKKLDLGSSTSDSVN